MHTCRLALLATLGAVLMLGCATTSTAHRSSAAPYASGGGPRATGAYVPAGEETLGREARARRAPNHSPYGAPAGAMGSFLLGF